MGSVMDSGKCKLCGGVTYEEYYYNTGEEFAICPRCGYNKQIMARETKMVS